jgi:hypothetical protein
MLISAIIGIIIELWKKNYELWLVEPARVIEQISL